MIDHYLTIEVWDTVRQAWLPGEGNNDYSCNGPAAIKRAKAIAGQYGYAPEHVRVISTQVQQFWPYDLDDGA